MGELNNICKSKVSLNKNKKKSINSNSSSYSFLELPWSHNEDYILENAKYLDKYRNSIENQLSTPLANEIAGKEDLHTESALHICKMAIDPLFYQYMFVIPHKIKRFISNPSFNHTFDNSNYLKVFKNESLALEIQIFDFKGDEIDMSTKLVFVINKKRIKQRFASEENKNYKNAITLNLDYQRGENRFKSMCVKILEYQIKHKVNLIEINNADDMLRELKSIAKNLESEKTYVPKVKTFEENQKEFFCYILAMIPGVSKNLSNTLVDKFNNISAFFRFLQENDKETLENIEVWNEDQTKKRKLGEKQSELLKAFFDK